MKILEHKQKSLEYGKQTDHTLILISYNLLLTRLCSSLFAIPITVYIPFFHRSIKLYSLWDQGHELTQPQYKMLLHKKSFVRRHLFQTIQSMHNNYDCIRLLIWTYLLFVYIQMIRCQLCTDNRAQVTLIKRLLTYYLLTTEIYNKVVFFS